MYSKPREPDDIEEALMGEVVDKLNDETSRIIISPHLLSFIIYSNIKLVHVE
jgi:hypothetical protein